MAKSKKHTNAISTNYNNISFASKLEVTAYKMLEKTIIPFCYEKRSIKVMESFEDSGEFHTSQKNSSLKARTNKVQAIHYTPDFEDNFEDMDWGFVIEVKGVKKASYMYRAKLFRKWRTENSVNIDFYECRSKKDLYIALEDICYKYVSKKYGIKSKNKDVLISKIRGFNTLTIQIEANLNKKIERTPSLTIGQYCLLLCTKTN